MSYPGRRPITLRILNIGGIELPVLTLPKYLLRCGTGFVNTAVERVLSSKIPYIPPGFDRRKMP
jgi:hypothetical protein